MKYGKREYRLPKTENRQETGKAESGQVSWVLGLFLILFLAILLYMQLQLAMYKASARYLEDALALSNLASAVIDIREYGSTHKVHITDQEQAYAGYCSAVCENLGLNENYEAVGHKLISGKVEIRNYIIYNVTGSSERSKNISMIFSSSIITPPPFRLHSYTTVSAANTTSNPKLFSKNYHFALL